MKNLNQEQFAVVNSSANFKLVVAGPGSGKTKTLVAAIEQTIESGMDPGQIVVITFTNAAAAELQDRLYDKAEMMSRTASEPLGWVGTLHGFLFRLLRQHGKLVRLPETLSVLDDEQQEGIVESVMADLGVKTSSKKVMPLLKLPNLVEGMGGMAYSKEELVAKEYHDRLRRAGLLDFDTILHYGEQLICKMRDDGGVNRWPYKCLFVDEAQDSSDSDWRIYDAMPCAKKFMVGDGDQAIYSFRGGNVREFVERSAGSQDNSHAVFTLQTNYRSKIRICQAAQSLIEYNPNRVPKATLPATTDVGSVTLNEFDAPAGELCFVMNEVVSRYPNTPPDNLLYTDFAVLCRTNKMAEEFGQFLKARGVPVRERKFKQDPPDWRKAKLLLTVLANPWNDMAAHAYLSLKLSRAEADTVKRGAAKAMMSITEFGKFKCVGGVELSMTAEGISSESRERVHGACRILSSRGEWTIPDLLMFMNGHEEERETEGEGVFVGTAHSAKGREFECVFVVGCEEGMFPSSKSIKAGDEAVEEERRLFYVAMTRAKDRLYLTRCKARPQNRGPNVAPGPMEPREASRFIKETAQPKKEREL